LVIISRVPYVTILELARVVINDCPCPGSSVPVLIFPALFQFSAVFVIFFFQISTSILLVGAGFFIYLFIFGARGFGILSSRLISLTGLVLVST
jgi:hypothetical protein